MGIDLKAGGRVVGHKKRTTPKSENVYLNLLVKLYQFLARRTGSAFCETIVRRLVQSRNNRPPIGLKRLLSLVEGRTDKIVVFVGTVTDDTRLDGFDVPAIRLCALRVTETARARILKAGGEIITFDQLALQEPKGSNTVLIRGAKNVRAAVSYRGVPGAPGQHAK